MKYFLTFLTLSLLFSQELEVEGDLKVTGTVESATIDSLEQIIANMQVQIDAMQDAENKLETRVYELPRIEFLEGNEYDLDISYITGYDLDYGILKLVHVNDFDISTADMVNIALHSTFAHNNGSESSTSHSIEIHNTGGIDYGHGGGRDNVVFHNGQSNIYISYNWSVSGWVDLVLAVTAPFPD